MRTATFLFNAFLLGILSMFLYNCAQKAASPAEEISLKELYKDSVYLEIEGDLEDPHIIWGNSKTYIPAFYRVTKHSHIIDNQIVFDFQSPDEIRISPNIYEYILDFLRQMNQQAKENGWKIIKEHETERLKDENWSSGDGYIYIFERVQENQNTKAGSIVLKTDAHLKNFMYLAELIDKNISGNLNDYIDIVHSNFRGNGVGDVYISGAYDTRQHFPPDEEYSYWAGYYCCNGCAFQSSNSCEHNNIGSIKTNGAAPVIYTKLTNTMGYPLITIRNFFYYSMLKKIGVQ